MNQTSLSQVPITAPVFIALTNVNVKRKFFSNIYTVKLDEKFMINASCISEISTDEHNIGYGETAKTTCIYLSDGDYFEVAESPSQIIELISESFRKNYPQHNL